MPDFRINYCYDMPSPQYPCAENHGATTIEADDEDDARYKFTGRHDMKNVKGLRIKSVEEI